MDRRPQLLPELHPGRRPPRRRGARRTRRLQVQGAGRSSCSPPTTVTWRDPIALRQKGNLIYDENFHVPLVIVPP